MRLRSVPTVKAPLFCLSLALFALTPGCDPRPSDEPSESGGSAPGVAIVSVADTARVVELAKRSLCSDEDPCWMSLNAYEADTAGVLVTLYGTDSLGQLVPGGGGKVRVTRAGTVRVLERYQ